MQAISSSILDLGKRQHQHEEDALVDLGASTSFMLPTTADVSDRGNHKKEKTESS